MNVFREYQTLSGLWRFQPDPFEEGEARGFFAVDYDARRWREVVVPITLDRCAPTLASYEGAGWFRRDVDVPESWAGKRVVLRCEAVNYHAEIWVNGKLAGGNEAGFLPFELPIHDHLEYGAPNTVVIRADNTRRPGDVPGLERGWRPYGGILRDVGVIATDHLHLAQVNVTANHEGHLAVLAEVRNDRAFDVRAAMEMVVTDAAGARVAVFEHEPGQLTPGDDAEYSLTGQISGVTPWTPDAPVLYTAVINLTVNGQVVDMLTVRFGFRTVTVVDARILLNDQPLFLTGFNRHEDSPEHDLCTDLAMARRDFRHMKELGANFVRLCHYPHDPGELDLCDELGLLVMDEIPLYWWHGLAEGAANCAAKLAAARHQVAAMVRRDINHPSVIFWSVSNETDDMRAEVAAGNRELAAYARELDPTRLVTHVSNHWYDYPNGEADDVVCVNAYPTWARHDWERNDQHKFASAHQWWADKLTEAQARTPDQPVTESMVSGRWWQEKLAALHDRYPDKPILVSEFGYPALESIVDSAIGEDKQAESIIGEARGMTAPYVCGITIWCYADHPWPEERFINFLTTSPFGVVSRERRRKSACAAVRALFHERQGRALPAPAPPGNPHDIPVQMIRPHTEGLPVLAFPEGFGIRPMRCGEAALWQDIQRDAERLMHIDHDLFLREFGDDLPATERRCFFIVTSSDVAVGTLSGWYSRDYRGEDYGRIHWVAIRPAYQGRGLIKPAMSHVLRFLAEHHERCWLATSTGRIPAIKVYLDCGFLPVIEDSTAHAAWASVQATLAHPALAAALGAAASCR